MRVFVPLADGFDDIEAFTTINVLRRGGIAVDIVGIVGAMATSQYGIRIFVDRRLNEINPDHYDAVVLPGGNPGYMNLSRSGKLLDLMKRFDADGKLIAAIGASPVILAKLGFLDNKKATVYVGMERELPYPRGAKVVVDDNIITAQGPGAAMDFALKIVEKLMGASVVSSIRSQLVV